MGSKELILSGDSGLRASHPQGAPPSGVWPNSLVNKTLLPALSHFYAHPHPFPTDSAIPRTLVMCLCLLKTPRLSPGVAHATLHRKVSTLCISFLYTAHVRVSSLHHPTTRKMNILWCTTNRYQRRNRAVPPVRASSCPQSTLVCEAAVFGTVIVKTIRSI